VSRRPRRALLTAVMLAALGGCPAALVSSSVASAAAGGAGVVGAAAPRTSLPTIERQVMCVTCKIPLNVAQSPQSNRERAYIQSLIDRGETEAQIKRALVVEYGAAVLGLPSTHGFDLIAYLVPLAVLGVLLTALAVLLPRWRRQARVRALPQAPPAISSTDAARLDAELSHFD
jgi:cytochrome c-type biogenesis protein CcmH